jgi:putative membrane protein
MMWWYNGPGGMQWWEFGLGSLFMLAFWAVVIVLAIWAIRQFAPRQESKATALTILEERFAKGEIDRKEFDERKAALSGS